MKSLLELLQAHLVYDLVRLEPGVKGTDRDFITICRRVEHEGLGFLTKTLPSLCDAFDEGLAAGRFTCPDGFKRAKGGVIPRLFSGILCEIFNPLDGSILDFPNMSLIKSMRGLCRKFKKLGLTSDNETKLDDEAKSKFFSVESLIADLTIGDSELFTLESICKSILPNLDRFDRSELPYRHGPGAVAETSTMNQKWNIVLEEDCLVSYGADILQYKNDPMKPVTVTSRDSAKLVTVPKDSKSRRTITIEPCWRQYVQQGYNSHLRSHIEKCGILRNSLSLTDQAKNQHLALIGSRTDKWATIDLSSASDLLSTSLVKAIFKFRPEFLNGILDCRSPKVNDSLTLRKFAGMGNATTFPVQSVCFAVLSIAAILHGSKYPWYGNIVRVSRMVRVYGDDIIVPTKYAHQVVRWLTLAGLKVNERKSFLSGKFKESCGVDAYDGVDVTPTYVRIHPSSIQKRDPSSLAHYTWLANKFFADGLYKVAEVCTRLVEEEIGRLPLVRSDSGCLGLHTRQEASHIHKWCKNLHKPLLRAYRLVPIYRKDALDGYGALFKCLTQPFQEDAKHLERSPVRFRNKLRLGWVAS